MVLVQYIFLYLCLTLYKEFVRLGQYFLLESSDLYLIVEILHLLSLLHQFFRNNYLQ